MSQEEMNTQQNTNGNYQDPIVTSEGKPAKKKMGGSTIAATIVSVVVFFLFGIIGGLICYGGYWAVYAIAKSKMPLAAKIILGIIVGLVFVVLLFIFIVFAAALRASV